MPLLGNHGQSRKSASEYLVYDPKMKQATSPEFFPLYVFSVHAVEKILTKTWVH